MRRTWSIAYLCLMALSANAGCTSLTKGKQGSKSTDWSITKLWKKEYQQPQQMAAIWSHDILAATGKPLTRGFGGRVYFYNERSQPIPVEGELIVHGFEEKPGVAREYTTESDKRFRFTAEQFTNHFSESELGASYSVWLPWDLADGPQKEITLIPTFKSSNGQVVQGTPAKLVLPSKGLTSGSAPVQTVSYQSTQTPTADGLLPTFGANLNQTSERESGMKTTTINLPPKTAQRLSSPGAYVESTNITSPSNQQRNTENAISPAKVQAILEQLNSLNANSVANAPQASLGTPITPSEPTNSSSTQSTGFPTPTSVRPSNSLGIPPKTQSMNAFAPNRQAKFGL